MNKSLFYDFDEYRRVYAEQNLRISKSDNPPPFFFKSKTTGKVFATLSWDLVGGSIYLDDYTPLNQDEVYYSAETREWVLGSIRLSEVAYQSLKGRLSGRQMYVEVKPVPEEAQPSPPEWGPETP